MRHLLCLLTLIAAISILPGDGSLSASTSPIVKAAEPAGGDWGFLQFAEVRAYRINWDNKGSCEPIAGRWLVLDVIRAGLSAQAIEQ